MRESADLLNQHLQLGAPERLVKAMAEQNQLLREQNDLMRRQLVNLELLSGIRRPGDASASSREPRT